VWVDGKFLPWQILVMHERTYRFRQIVARQGWSDTEVAAELGRTERTARAWRCGACVIPAHSLEMLELRLQLAATQAESRPE